MSVGDAHTESNTHLVIRLRLLWISRSQLQFTIKVTIAQLLLE